jgi:hypothetical protein
MGNAAAPKITTRSFVFQHADSGNCQKPKSQTCLRTAGYHQESRQRRAGQFPVPIRTLGISRHRVAYRGDNRSCRIIYPINGLHALNAAGCLIYEQGPIDFVGR